MRVEIWIVFLPLLGSLLCGLFGKTLGDRLTLFLSCSAMFGSAILSILLFSTLAVGDDVLYTVPLFPWISSGDLELQWALRVDMLSVSMLAIVSSISFLVHVYSVGYMRTDPHKPRFFCYLGLFTFCMLMLVTAGDLGQLFFGWEGVGLCSYLLIGFWHRKPSANAAAMKAFLVNRVGDIGFALGVASTFFLFGSIRFDEIFMQAPSLQDRVFSVFGLELHALTLICILFFVGAMAKSAQLGLHTWLPDAMEGPTPVSALIHAATMVTAGVFLICRLSPLFEEAVVARHLVTYVGAFTALFAASVAITQNDIKRVVAYSTCSQLGYMFFAAGLSAYSSAMFHLMTHAFFKALLFLGAGSVIQALSHQQDLRKMGGLRKFLPFTYIAMLVGSLSLSGVPPLSGAFSKDAILESAWISGGQAGVLAFVLGTLSALLTALYAWRLIFLTFHGSPRSDADMTPSVREPSLLMSVPVFLLAVGAAAAGWLAKASWVGEAQSDFWGNSLADSPRLEEHVPLAIGFLPTIMAVSGIFLAWTMWQRNPSWPKNIAQVLYPFYRFLYRKWFFDELFAWLLVLPCKRSGAFLWNRIDRRTIDAFGPNGVRAVASRIARVCTRVQSGYIYHYAFLMLTGIFLFATWSLYVLTGASG